MPNQIIFPSKKQKKNENEKMFCWLVTRAQREIEGKTINKNETKTGKNSKFTYLFYTKIKPK